MYGAHFFTALFKIRNFFTSIEIHLLRDNVAMGWKGITMNQPDDVGAKLMEAFAHDGPVADECDDKPCVACFTAKK